jgi:hypothetical protein
MSRIPLETGTTENFFEFFQSIESVPNLIVHGIPCSNFAFSTVDPVLLGFDFQVNGNWFLSK